MAGSVIPGIGPVEHPEHEERQVPDLARFLARSFRAADHFGDNRGHQPVVIPTDFLDDFVWFATQGFQLEGTGFQLSCVLGVELEVAGEQSACLLYTSPSPRDGLLYRMP